MLLRITNIIPETHNVKTLVLDSETPVAYKAGQYLTFVFGDGQHEVRRSYSIASSPVLKEPLSITVKRIENGMVSRPLFDRSREGDVLVASGTGGFFVLPDDLRAGQQLFFFAAGSGIVPVYSLIKTLLHAHRGVQVVLVYSNRSHADVIYHRPLQALQQRYASSFRLELLFSLSADLARARLNPDLLQQLVRQYAAAPQEEMLFYACGPFAYMRMIAITLHTMGFAAAQLRKEQFSHVAPAYKPAPPDTRAHSVEIRAHGQTHNIRVQYPVTILQAAKRAGISLPYSCEAGKCGNCAAQCLSGKIWMMYNEVLLEDELKKGLVLTCSGFPVDGDAVIAL